MPGDLDAAAVVKAWEGGERVRAIAERLEVPEAEVEAALVAELEAVDQRIIGAAG